MSAPSGLSIQMATLGARPGSSGRIAIRQITLGKPSGKITVEDWVEPMLHKKQHTPLRARSTTFPVIDSEQGEAMEAHVRDALSQGYQLHTWSGSGPGFVTCFASNSDSRSAEETRRLASEYFGEVPKSLDIYDIGFFASQLSGCIISPTGGRDKRVLEHLAFVAAIDRNAVLFGMFGTWLSITDYVHGRINELPEHQQKFCWDRGLDAPLSWAMDKISKIEKGSELKYCGF